jgi:hypothetical protein
MRAPTRRILMILLMTTVAAGCASVPGSRLLVPTDHISAKQIESVDRASGNVIDVLTVSGEEIFVLLDSAGNRVLTGQLVDTSSAQLPAGQQVTVPLDEAALVYYVAPASTAKQGHTAASGPPFKFPRKIAYPELPSVGAAERKFSCEQLDLALSRAEAVRWFARDEGLMAYTPGQELAHHAITTAIVAGVTFVVLASAAGGGGGGGWDFSDHRPVFEDPASSLRDQVGEGELRWAINAADARIAGLLRIKRERDCAQKSTLVESAGDLQVLQRFDALHEGQAARKLSAAALLQEQTKLLDMLGPRPLPEGSLADCGLFHCPARAAEEAIPIEAPPERPEAGRDYPFVHWYPGTDNISNLKTFETGMAVNFRVTETALVFQASSEGMSKSAKPMTRTQVRIPYDEIASIKFSEHRMAGSILLHPSWIVVTRTDGRVDSFAVVRRVFPNQSDTQALAHAVEDARQAAAARSAATVTASPQSSVIALLPH